MVLEVEQLEDRTVPTMLIWNGPAGGNWSVAANWKDGATGNPAVAPPASGDILEFSGKPADGTQTSSVDNMSDLTVVALRVLVGFGQDIQLAQPLTIDPAEFGVGGDVPAVSFLSSGSISGENLTLNPGALLSWTDATQNGTGSSETIIEAGASLLIKPAATATLNERTLLVEAGATVSFTSGELQLDGEAAVINEGQFGVTGTAASIATQAGNGAPEFDNTGAGALIVNVGSFSILSRFTQESSKDVNIGNSIFQLGGGGTIAGGFIGTTPTTRFIFSTGNYNWETGAAFNGRLAVFVPAGAVVNLTTGITVPFTPLAGLIVNGGTIAGQGTIQIQKAATATLNNATLSGAKIDNSGTVELSGNGTLQMNLGASIVNTNTFNIADDSSILGDGASMILNNGTFQKTDGKGNSVIDIHVITTNPLNPPAKGKWEFTHLEKQKKQATLDVGGTQVVGLLDNEGGVDFGSGTVVGTFIANGDEDPGYTQPAGGSTVPNPGVISVDGTYTQGADGTLNIDIAGPTPGTQFSQLVVTSTVTLGGTLNVTALPGFTGDYFDILVNQSGTAIAGQFNGLPEGAELPLDGQQFFITYHGGPSGNDVVLHTAASIFATGGTPQSTTVGNNFVTPLQATVDDANGKPVPGVTVTFVAPSSGPSGTFAGGLTTVQEITNANGVATAPTFTANTSAGSYVVSANVSGVTTPADFDLTNNPGQAAAFTVADVANHNLETAGVPFDMTVTALDQYGNVAAGYSGTVSFSSSDPSASLPGNYTFTTAGIFTTPDAGIHHFSGVVLNTVGRQTITVTDTWNAALTGTGDFIVVGAQVPAIIFATGGTPQSTTVGTSFISALQASVYDANAEPVPGATVIFVAPASGPSGTFAGGLTIVQEVTDANGVAVAPTFTANTSAGSYVVSAYVSGVTTPADFDLTNNPGQAASFTVADAANHNLETAGVPFDLTVTALDQYGNVATGYMTTVTFTSSDPRASLPFFYTFTAADAGSHDFSGVVLNTLGPQTITASDGVNAAFGTGDFIVLDPPVSALDASPPDSSNALAFASYYLALPHKGG